MKGSEAVPDYVFSSALGGIALGDVTSPDTQPLISDGTHAATLQDSSTTPPLPATSNYCLYTRRDLDFRHNKGVVMAFADGHVETVSSSGVKFPYPISWAKADYGVTLSGSTVTKLADIGAQDVTQADGTGPTYVPATDTVNAIPLINNTYKPCMKFNGSGTAGSKLVGPVINSTTSAYFIVVRTPTTNPSAAQDFLSTRQADSKGGIELCVNTSGNILYYVFKSDGTNTNANMSVPGAGKWFLLSCVVDSSSTTVYINGGNKNQLGPPAPSIVPVTLGVKTGGGAAGFTGWVAEVIALDYAPSTGERQAIEDILFNKYTNIVPVSPRQ
ncbi:MAG TPA: LamG-like jellyroll fold domain-containing protein [Armatimonadota bacterium]|jgi:prepilin-type processing-associated H-X9-DG protein